MVRNLSSEMYPVVAYAHNLSSFFSYLHHNTRTYSDNLLFLKWWHYFHSTENGWNSSCPKLKKLDTFYWVKLKVHEAPWSQLSRSTYSGTVMQGNSCQARSCFSGLVTLTRADTGMAPPEPLVWQEGATQKPWGNDLVSWVTHRHLAADIQNSLWVKLGKIWSENGRP